MLIRAMTGKDIPELLKMLSLEDEHDGSYLTSANTFIFEDEEGMMGFYTIKIEHDVPVLVHFIVKRERRSVELTRLLIKELRKRIKSMGFSTGIIAVKKDYLKRYVEYYAKRKPYAERYGVSFYLMEA